MKRLGARFRSLLILLSILGFLDAVYLFSRGSGIPCSITHGCEIVLQSQYASIFGIPVSLIGVAYYLGILVLALAEQWNAVRAVVAAGFLATLWFLFTQAVLLQAFCLYCLVSAAITIMLFILILYASHKGLWRKTAI
jgi:uncharacterized membrane protein